MRASRGATRAATPRPHPRRDGAVLTPARAVDTALAGGTRAPAAPHEVERSAATHLFVLPWDLDDPGGVNEVVKNLYRRFAQDGGAVPHVLVTSWPHRKPASAIEDGRAITRMRLRAPVVTGQGLRAPAKWALSLLPEIVRLARLLRARRVAVVNVHFPSLAALQVLLARPLCGRRPRLVLSFHGLDLAQAEASRGLARTLW